MSNKVWVRMQLFIVRTPSAKFILYEQMENGFYKLLKFTNIDGLCQFLRDMNIVEEEIQKPASDFTLEEIKSELVQYDGEDIIHDDDFSEEQVAKELQEEEDTIADIELWHIDDESSGVD